MGKHLSKDATGRWQFYAEQPPQSDWKDEKPIIAQITSTNQFNILFVICSHCVLKKIGSLNEFWLNKPAGIDCSLGQDDKPFFQISSAGEKKEKKQKKKNLSSAGAENCYYLSLEWYHLPFVLKVKPTIKKSIIRIQTLQTPGSPHYFQDFAITPSLHARLIVPACFRTSSEIFQASGSERERSRLVDFSAWRGARSAWMIRTVGGWTHRRGKRQVVVKGVVQKESRRRGRGRLLPPLWMGERQTGKYSKHQADRRTLTICRWLLLTAVESRLPVRPHLVWHVYPQAAFWQCLRLIVSTLPFQSCLSLFRSLSVNSGTAVELRRL